MICVSSLTFMASYKEKVSNYCKLIILFILEVEECALFFNFKPLCLLEMISWE